MYRTWVAFCGHDTLSFCDEDSLPLRGLASSAATKGRPAGEGHGMCSLKRRSRGKSMAKQNQMPGFDVPRSVGQKACNAANS